MPSLLNPFVSLNPLLFSCFTLLDEGCWMRVFYLGGTEFNIEIIDREFRVVTDYHQFPNHYEFGWKNEDKIEDAYDSGPETEDWVELEYCDVQLSTSHLQKNKKALPKAFVRNALLPHKPSFCTLRDEQKKDSFVNTIKAAKVMQNVR